MSPWFSLRGGRREQLRFALFILLLASVAALGGAARPDVWSLLILRPLTVLLVAAMLIVPGPVQWRLLRAPGLLLIAFAATMLLQLIPLPPTLWLSLPGHAPYGEAAVAAGIAQPWRPLSLSPDSTLNSLVSLLVPAAALIGAASLKPGHHAIVLPAVLVIAGVSAVLGLLQVATGAGLYFYAITNVGRPVGLFANVNHQAALLAAALPMLAAWGVAGRGPVSTLRLAIALASSAFLFTAVLVSGSRGGLLLAALALAAIPPVIGDRFSIARRWRYLGGGAGFAAVAGIILAAALAGRNMGVDRLLATSATGVDGRVAFLPITLGLLRRFLPFGSGFGTFADLFRGAEPDNVLRLTYFNHAHNDLLELGITGGVPALMVLAVLLVWLARRVPAAFGRASRASEGALTARAGIVTILLFLLASLIDYPLRTPLAATVFVLAGLWTADLRARSFSGADAAIA